MEFSDIEKINAHIHYSITELDFMDLAVDDKFSFVSIHVDVPFFTSNKVMEVHQFDRKLKGLDLPGDVLVKLDSGNDLKWCPCLKDKMIFNNK